MGHPRFTEDFKADAIKQITERGHSVSDVSQPWASVPTHCTLGQCVTHCQQRAQPKAISQ